ncbi:MAG: hypothetical protein MUC29_01905 [Pyrinomonadaceae bacterium]|jgi:hypothetical protein|nr:hypothetical protein [Pyrinomonadaceae bacterium]
MAAVLNKETLQDEIAVSVAKVLASANRKANELGVDVKASLITVSQHLAQGVWLWRVHYGKREYIGRRGGDLMIDINPKDSKIEQILQGQ